MASVQELIAAVSARQPRSALAELVNSFTGGYGQGVDIGNRRLETSLKLIQIEQAKKEMEQQAEMQKQIKEQMDLQTEAGAIRPAFNGIASPGTPAKPANRLEVTINQDEKGRYSRTIKPKEVKTPNYQKAEYSDPLGKTRIGRFNPDTGIVEQKPEDPFAPQSERTAGEAGNLRKEFIDRPEVKEFVTINTQVKSMDSLLSNALKGNMKNKLALDQSLITMYNKLTDPQSVVRESEYARTPENLPVVNRITGAIQKLEAGGAGITNEDRQALVIGAKIIANERGGVFNERRGEYETLSKKLSVDPEIVTGTLKPFKPYEIKPLNISSGENTVKTIKPPEPNMIHIQASDGSIHWVKDLNKAKEIDPKLKVIQ